MVLIKETTLFTALLTCVLAASLPNEYQPNPYVPVVSYIPDKGILPTPHSEDKIDLPRPYVVIPSWQHKSNSNKPKVYKEEQKSPPKKLSDPVHTDVSNKKYKPQLDMILPNVKLGFGGLSGMVEKLKKAQRIKATNPEPPTVVIKPGQNRSKPDEKYENGQTPMFNPENSYILNYKLPITYQYTAPVKPERLRDIDYTTASETDYRQHNAEEQSIRSYKTDHVDDRYPTNFDYSTYTSVSYDDIPRIPYKAKLPQSLTTPSSLKNLAVHTSPYNERPVAQKPTYNYRPTQPIGKEDQLVELPPVPKGMSLLQRIYIALLNTISGLPGGSPGTLDAIRAG